MKLESHHHWDYLRATGSLMPTDSGHPPPRWPIAAMAIVFAGTVALACILIAHWIGEIR
jgi:hypothetical protein